jgi:hypothetical protein
VIEASRLCAISDNANKREAIAMGVYAAHATAVGHDTVLTFGGDPVTLVGVGLDSLAGDGIVIA